MLPVSLETRHIPWVLCTVLALWGAVSGLRSGNDATKIAQMETRLHQLEKKAIIEGELDSYSTIPAPVEELPPLDSSEFYAKCEQWNVNPDKIKTLARRLAREQGIEVETSRVATAAPAVETPRRVTPRSSLVAIEAPHDPLEPLLVSSTKAGELFALAGPRTDALEQIKSKLTARPMSHRRRSRHRSDA